MYKYDTLYKKKTQKKTIALRHKHNYAYRNNIICTFKFRFSLKKKNKLN